MKPSVRQDAFAPLRTYALGSIDGAIRSTLSLERVLQLEARVLVACEVLGIDAESRVLILETARDDARRELGPEPDCFDVRLFAAELVLAYLKILTRRNGRGGR